mgnify:CR=1 FL=1
MPEEKRIEEMNPELDSAPDYIAAIKELKENTVDRAQYMKLKEENKRLLDNMINGFSPDQPAPVKEAPDINALRNDLFNKDNTNLDFCRKAVELRDALIENGEIDPFLPYGKQIQPTREDVESAEHVANVIKECIDYADGDSQIFTQELQRRTVDTGPQFNFNRRY